MKKHSTKLALFLVLLITILSTIVLLPSQAASEPTYTKVTTAPTDWSGEYLIVYEGGNVIFDGSLTKFDAVGNNQSVTIADGIITGDYSAYSFTIAVVDGGYSIQGAGGKYIGNASNSNALTTSDAALVNTISINDDGSVNIIGAGGAYLRYNSVSNQVRFRYFKSGSYTNQQPIALYKFVPAGDASCTHTNVVDIVANAPTCTEKGNETGTKCADCGYVISGGADIDALGHTETAIPAVDKTCTTDGATAGVKCSVCNEVLTAPEVISAEHGDIVDGKCEVCGETLEEVTYSITINRDSFPGSSGYAWHDWSATTKTGEIISGSGFIYATTKNSIQVNGSKSGDYIYNTTPLPGNIVSITLTKASGTDRNFDILTSDTPFDSAVASLKGQATDAKKLVTTEGVTWTFETSHKYFAIVICDSSAAYLSTIEIKYSVDTAQLECEHTNTTVLPAVGATCTEAGLTEGLKCLDCEKIVTAQETIPAAGHTYVDDVCTVCGHSLYTSISEILTNGVLNEKYSVKGVITYVSGRQVYIQDSTGASLSIYLGAADSTLKVGDAVNIIDGTYSLYVNTVKQLSSPASCTVTSSSNEVSIKEVTLAQVAEGGYNAYPNQIVLIKGVTIGTVDSKYTPVTFGDSTVNIYNAPSTTPAAGTVVDLVAIVSGYDGNVQFTVAADGYTVVKGNLKPEYATLALSNDIAIRFYIPKTSVIGYTNVKLVGTLGTETVEVALADAEVNGDYYVFTFSKLAPSKAADEVTFQIVADEKSGEAKTYSIKEYCENQLADSSASASLKTLCANLLNFCASIEGNTDINSNAAVAENATNTAPTGTVESPVDGSVANVTLKSASLKLTSGITVRFTVLLDNGITPDDLILTVNNEDAELVYSGSGNVYYVYYIAGNATEYASPIELVVTDGNEVATVTYSVETYATRMYNKETSSAETKAVALALYNYIDAINKFANPTA